VAYIYDPAGVLWHSLSADPAIQPGRQTLAIFQNAPAVTVGLFGCVRQHAPLSRFWIKLPLRDFD
jgi:hypothetical protein